MSDEKYTPEKIPTSITKNLCVWYCFSGWQEGQIGVYDINDAWKGSEDKIVLCRQNVTFDIPVQGDNTLRDAALDALNSQKEKILAEHHVKLKSVQDKIDSLLAIEHKPEPIEEDAHA